MRDIIKTVDLTKTYKGTSVVKDVNLSVRKGEIYGFIGRNGAGKTTTMRMILNLVRPTGGHGYGAGR
jgi:ABC-type multidrug transport system ATPase subunit